MKRKITEYEVRSDKIEHPLDLAVVADLHDSAYEDVMPVLRRVDAILIPGDLVDRHAHLSKGYEWAARFLQDAPKCAPTFYSMGNHERKIKWRAEYMPLVEASEVCVLDDCYVRFGGIVLGGMSSQTPGGENDRVAQAMAQEPGFRLLMCHHPEYYERYVKGRGIDLTIAGHAHGGQVQLFGRGLYAPGQGLMPRITHGWYDNGRLLVSRGMTNKTWAPRLWNPCELLLLHLRPEEKK